MPEGKNKIEVFKEQSHSLRGTIATALQQETTRFAEADSHVLKFHGVYQQDGWSVAGGCVASACREGVDELDRSASSQFPTYIEPTPSWR